MAAAWRSRQKHSAHTAGTHRAYSAHLLGYLQYLDAVRALPEQYSGATGVLSPVDDQDILWCHVIIRSALKDT